MPAFIANTQKILYFDPDSARTTVSVFTEEIRGGSQEQGFSIFLLAEIRGTEHAENQYFLRELQNTFVRFFNDQQGRLTESMFEEGLHELNKYIPALIENRNPDFVNSVSLVAGALSGNVLHFSQVGPATLLLMQGSKILDLANRAQIGGQNPLKLFREIASGKIETGDVMFISTTNFLDYFSQEKIKRLLQEHIEESISKGFDPYLLQAPVSVAFAALTLSLVKGKITSVQEYIEQPQQVANQPGPYSRSMETLIEREQATDEILTPKFFPFIKKKIILTYATLRSAVKKYILRKPSRVSPIIAEQQEKKETPMKYRPKGKSMQLKKLRTRVYRLTIGLFRSIRHISKKTWGGISQLRPHMLSRNPQADLAPAVRSSEISQRRGVLEWFSSLQQKRKLLLIVAILLVAAFAQSIVFSGMRERNQEQEAIQEQLRTNIANATAQIDAALLYGDDARIQSAVDDLQRELAALEESEGNEQLIQETQDAIALAERKLQRIQEIIDPIQVADLTTTASSARVIALTQINNSTVALDPANKSLYITQNGETTETASTTNDEQIPILFTPLGESLYIVNQELSLSRYSLGSDSIVGVSFTPPEGSANLVAIASYGNRLYFIDSAGDQILRSNQSGGGFSQPANWLFNDTPLANANGIAIDGSIYVSFDNGAIRKFTQGREDTFTLPDISPALESIDGIWTNELTNFLYILDSSQSRVIKVNKNNGTLQEQLVVPGLPNLVAFAVSENAQSVYVATESAIYSLPLTQ